MRDTNATQRSPQVDDCTLIDWSVLERHTRTEQYELYRTALEQIDQELSLPPVGERIARVEEILMALGRDDRADQRTERQGSEAERLSDTIGEMARAEREMVQAQTPVVNVEGEAE